MISACAVFPERGRGANLLCGFAVVDAEVLDKGVHGEFLIVRVLLHGLGEQVERVVAWVREGEASEPEFRRTGGRIAGD